MFVIAAVLLFVAIYVAKLPAYCCNGGHEYRKINAYISTLWIPAYLLRDTRDVLSGDLDVAGPAFEASGAAVSIYDVARSVGASAHLSDPTRGRGASSPPPPVAPLKTSD